MKNSSPTTEPAQEQIRSTDPTTRLHNRTLRIFEIAKRAAEVDLSGREELRVPLFQSAVDAELNHHGD
jgi:hypothetical protein